MFASDVAVSDWVAGNAPWLVTAAPILGALLVVVLGKLMAGRMARRPAASSVDLAAGERAAPPTHRR
jgi:hypothetical protein